MGNRSLTAGRRGEASAATELTSSVEALDQKVPGWDAKVRALGIIRRLERNSSVSGVQAAVDVYGEEAVFQTLPCAGLVAINCDVVGLDGKLRYRSAAALDREMQAKVIAAFNRSGGALSAPELELIQTLFNAPRTLQQLAQQLNVSEARLHRARKSLLRIAEQATAITPLPSTSIDWARLAALLKKSEKTGSERNRQVGGLHPVDTDVLERTEVARSTQTEIVFSGSDQEIVSQIAAEVRAARPPEPYRGKGIRYVGENIVRKESKKK